ncbi:Tyrosyl-DNA phosphodiesterase 1, partial [Galemys pyrenaicus]
MTPPIYARVQHRCAHLRMRTLECLQHHRCPSSVKNGSQEELGSLLHSCDIELQPETPQNQELEIRATDSEKRGRRVALSGEGQDIWGMLCKGNLFQFYLARFLGIKANYDSST